MDLCHLVTEAMARQRAELGAVGYCILIKGYGRSADVRGLDGLLAHMHTERVRADAVTYNALIDAYARNARMSVAETVLAQMRNGRMQPSSRSFNPLLRGYVTSGRRGGLHSAFSTLRRMRSELGPHGPDLVSYNLLVDGCVRYGRLGLAQAILRGLSRGGGGEARRRWRPQPDVVAFTTVMRGLLDAGRPLESAIDLLSEMRAARVRCSSDTRAPAIVVRGVAAVLLLA